MCILSLSIATGLAASLGTALASAGSAAMAAIGLGGATAGAATAATGGIGAAVGAAAAGSGAAAGASAAAAGAGAVASGLIGGTAATTTAAAGTSMWGLAGAMALEATMVGATVAGGVAGTVSDMQQAEAAAKQAEFMAGIEEENARLAGRNAEAIGLQGNQERLQLRNRMLQQKGSGRAAYAAGGVVLGSGSAADYEADIADAYDLDKRNLDYDIKSRQWQMRVQSTNASNQASIYRAQAKGYRDQKGASLLSGVFGTAGNALSAGVSATMMSDKLGLLKLKKA